MSCIRSCEFTFTKRSQLTMSMYELLHVRPEFGVGTQS